MIIVLHGDDIVRSRNALIEQKKQFLGQETYRFEGESAIATDIIQTFEAQSLFAAKKLIILERFIQTKDKELVALILNHLRKNLAFDVILFEEKEIKKELLSLLPKDAKVFFFKQNRLLFTFLDSIKPGNTKATLTLFHDSLKTESIELLFYMLVRHFRLLLAEVTGAQISEYRRLAPWQRGKLQRQGRYFSEENLVKLYNKLFQIEKETKTGTSPFSLVQAIDLFLAQV